MHTCIGPITRSRTGHGWRPSSGMSTRVSDRRQRRSGHQSGSIAQSADCGCMRGDARSKPYFRMWTPTCKLAPPQEGRSGRARIAIQVRETCHCMGGRLWEVGRMGCWSSLRRATAVRDLFLAGPGSLKVCRLEEKKRVPRGLMSVSSVLGPAAPGQNGAHLTGRHHGVGND